MDHCTCGLFIAACMTSIWSFTTANPLNDYILDYQPIDFEHRALRDEHHRTKRESSGGVLHWTFEAYNRSFPLELRPTTDVFAPDHSFIAGSNAPITLDTSHIYDGHILGIPGSFAHIAIMSENVAGFVEVPSDTVYHIEPARNHLKDPSIHTIIYPENKMNLDPYKHLAAKSSCGSKEHFAKLRDMSLPLPETVARQKREAYNDKAYSYYNKYSERANSRHKRATPFSRGKTCNLYMRADKILFDHIKGQYSSDGSLTAEEKAREEIVSMFSIHVKAINTIYEATIFKKKDTSNPEYIGVRFQIQRARIFETCGEVEQASFDGNQQQWAVPQGYCQNNLDVSNFLDLTSKEDHSEFCLAYTFTRRDFVGGTLGLAWVATPDSGSSGVCAQYQWIADKSGSRAKKSLNTGVVTLVNFNQQVPSRVSQLTFAHEVGHNFGAEHDPTPSSCAPYGTTEADARDGNYIMFASAAQGNLPHNDLFSTCSRDYIAKVLLTLGDRRVDCFEASQQQFCGNQVVEEGEQCDCGYAGADGLCGDPCCYGKNSQLGTACTLVNGDNSCSPSQGQCCSSSCAVLSSSVVCRQENECQSETTCDGTNATCPSSGNKPNFDSYCNNNTRTCDNGECAASICKKVQNADGSRWDECMLSKADGVADDKMCYEACKNPASDQCVSSADSTALDLPANAPFKGILTEIQLSRSAADLALTKAAGSLCDNYLGYCDILSNCRKYDAEGPFKQLTDLIFDPMNFTKVADWITDHWWAVLLMGVGFVIFMGVFVWLFSYNTPKENPAKKRARDANRQQPGRSRPQPDKRGGVYSVDVPMHERRGQGYNGGSHQGSHMGNPNQGYDNRGFQGNPQNFDRISHPKRY